MYVFARLTANPVLFVHNNN